MSNAAAEDFMVAPVGVPTYWGGASVSTLVTGASGRKVFAVHPVSMTAL